jgi:hypothetical protein
LGVSQRGCVMGWVGSSVVVDEWVASQMTWVANVCVQLL